jgi:hypothetical protein
VPGLTPRSARRRHLAGSKAASRSAITRDGQRLATLEDLQFFARSEAPELQPGTASPEVANAEIIAGAWALAELAEHRGGADEDR